VRLIKGVWHMRITCRTAWAAHRMCERFSGTVRWEGGSPRVVWVPVADVERVTDVVAGIGYVSDHVYRGVRGRAAEWIAYEAKIKES
jgi:hypothetical protein